MEIPPWCFSNPRSSHRAVDMEHILWKNARWPSSYAREHEVYCKQPMAQSQKRILGLHRSKRSWDMLRLRVYGRWCSLCDDRFIWQLNCGFYVSHIKLPTKKMTSTYIGLAIAGPKKPVVAGKNQSLLQGHHIANEVRRLVPSGTGSSKRQWPAWPTLKGFVPYLLIR